MKSFGRNFVIWIALGILLMSIFNLFNKVEESPVQTLVFSDFVKNLETGNIADAHIQGNIVKGYFKDGKTLYRTFVPRDPMLINRLIQHDVRISAAPPEEEMSSFVTIFLSWIPMLLFIGIWIFFMKQMGGGGGKAMGFGKSKARLVEDKKKKTFADVAGIDEAKDDLEEIVEYLRDPQKFQKLGAKIPKGVLLVGPPGTGKTLLAKAVAGEADVPFFTISGSDFVEMFVGVGASRVRAMFEQGKKSAPCLIFIDEIDAVGRHRGAGLGGGNDEREQTLNQLLVEMDGFEDNEGVIIIAATNRPDVLDPALLRPGRFDRQVTVPNPDIDGREKILKVHLKNVVVSDEIDPRIIARGTPGFSGADLANLVNEAALVAARKEKPAVMNEDLEYAKDKVMMGSERRSMVMSDEEKKLTAYHEGGHALVAIHCPASDPIHKATIIPRGRALGMVLRLPEKDRISFSREKMMADLAVAAGGRIAEEVIFGKDKVTTGASSDIQMVTSIARKMVMEWGLSEKLGFLTYSAPEREVFLGHSVTETQNVSEETSKTIDSEVRKIVDEIYKHATKIITENIDQLHNIGKALIKYETLNGEEIQKAADGKRIIRKKPKKKKEDPKKEEVKKPLTSVPSFGEKPKTRTPSDSEPQA
ncbi:MAG: ATP-dependent zinc metalloprotease FtsH [Alphaproteobacteria bacterium]